MQISLLLEDSILLIEKALQAPNFNKLHKTIKQKTFSGFLLNFKQRKDFIALNSLFFSGIRLNA